jgi:methylated-DNA-[protein]-cysteine S-methyltransferase
MNKNPPSLFFRCFQTRFGEVFIIFSTTGVSLVKRIFLSRENLSASETGLSSFPEAISFSGASPIDHLTDEIQVMLSGGLPEFSLDLLDFAVCTEFQRRVLLEERKIPRGEVRSYGWLARQIGIPGGSRAVGNALANNPFPLVIPCHRTLRSDGRIGGFQGGPSMKRALLEMEGVYSTSCGKHLQIGRLHFNSGL